MTATASSPLHHAPTRDAVMAQAAHENFPVALRVLGTRRRKQLLALYAFARLADDAGDEAGGDRLALLDWLESDLECVYAHATPEHPVVRALAPVVHQLDLPAEPFRRLIEANRRDQQVDRYETFDELLDYCSLSAAPVGELVLYVFGAASEDRIALSDLVCAGLQVTEHLQDVAEDLARGRVYLPAADIARFGVTVADLAAPAPSERVRKLIAFEVSRARSLLSGGAPLIGKLGLRAAVAVAGFVAGGRAALGAIERANYDVLSARPRPTKLAVLRAVRWR